MLISFEKFRNMKRGTITLIGFVLVGLGFMTLVLSLIGVQLSFLTWMDYAGPLTAFIARLLMIMIGFIIIYLSTSNYRDQ